MEVSTKTCIENLKPLNSDNDIICTVLYIHNLSSVKKYDQEVKFLTLGLQDETGSIKCVIFGDKAEYFSKLLQI